MAFLAHISEIDQREQSIIAHLEATARRCAAFAAAFGAEAQGALAGMAHDIGKYSDGFQRRLLENGPVVDHSTAGALECAKDTAVPQNGCNLRRSFFHNISIHTL